MGKLVRESTNRFVIGNPLSLSLGQMAICRFIIEFFSLFEFSIGDESSRTDDAITARYHIMIIIYYDHHNHRIIARI